MNKEEDIMGKAHITFLDEEQGQCQMSMDHKEKFLNRKHSHN